MLRHPRRVAGLVAFALGVLVLFGGGDAAASKRKKKHPRPRRAPVVRQTTVTATSSSSPSSPVEATASVTSSREDEAPPLATTTTTTTTRATKTTTTTPPRETKTTTTIVVASRPQRPGRALVIGGATTLAIGAALVIGGGVAYALAQQTASDLVAAEQRGAPYDAALYHRGEQRTTAATACFAVGGALVATGAIVTAIGVLRGRARRDTVRVTPTGGYAALGFLVEGSF